MMFTFNNIEFGENLPPVEEMKKWIMTYIYRMKGVKAIPIINEGSSPREVELFVQAFRIAESNLTHGR